MCFPFCERTLVEVGAAQARALALDGVVVGAGSALAELAGLVRHGKLPRHHLHLIRALGATGLGLGGAGEPQEGEEDEEGEGGEDVGALHLGWL